MPTPDGTIESKFSTVASHPTEVKTEVYSQYFATTIDKVKITFSTYNSMLRETQEWMNSLGLGISVVGLGWTVKFSELSLFGIAINGLVFKTVCTMLGGFFLYKAINCIVRKFRYRKKLTIEHFLQQLRAENPEIF